MFLSKEDTWIQHLSKNQYVTVGKNKILKDPVIRDSQHWLSERFVEFDYTNDARFESFRDYPRKKQLYRKHKDIAKDYERKVKFYRSCQRWYSTETNRQIQKVEERFSKLLQYTFDSNSIKTKGLQKSYTKWTSEHQLPVNINKIHAIVHETSMESHDKFEEDNKETAADIAQTDEQPVNTTIESIQRWRNISVGSTITGPGYTERLHGLKSISLENLPKVEEDQRLVNKYSKHHSKHYSLRNASGELKQYETLYSESLHGQKSISLENIPSEETDQITVDKHYNHKSLRNVNLDKNQKETSLTERLHGIKSSSVENLQEMEEDQRNMGKKSEVQKQTQRPSMHKSVSSLTVRDIRHFKDKQYRRLSHLIKLTSN